MSKLSRLILPIAVRAIVGILITRFIISLFEEPKVEEEKPENLKKRPNPALH